MVRLIVFVVALALVAWLLTFLPIPEPFRTIVYVLMILLVIYEILALAGFAPSVWGYYDRRYPPP